MLHRRLLRLDDSTITIADTLQDAATCAIEAEPGLLINPALEMVLDGTRECATVRTRDRELAQFSVATGLSLTLQRGAADPRRGWHSASFGERTPACRLAVRAASAAAGEDAPPPPRHDDPYCSTDDTLWSAGHP